MTGNTLFVTYILTPTSGQTVGDYSEAIHCNYIKKIDLGGAEPLTQEISLNFPDISDFKFLASSVNGATNPLGTGYTAHKIFAVVQIVSNSGFTTADDIKPDSAEWKLFELTDQVDGYTTAPNFYLTPTSITSVVYKVSLLDYNDPLIFTSYNLDYLSYPEANNPEKLVFGDVSYFFGNVETDIKADVYTTDISIILPLNEFNSSTNKTWNGETVYITEVGIYDSNKNLVAIGKLNNPVAKDETIGRTIVFALDF